MPYTCSIFLIINTKLAFSLAMFDLEIFYAVKPKLKQLITYFVIMEKLSNQNVSQKM